MALPLRPQTSQLRPGWVTALVLLCLIPSCTTSSHTEPEAESELNASELQPASSAWSTPSINTQAGAEGFGLAPSSTKAPPVPKGMVWIPPGALVAGTPPAQMPRKADEEMPGEQVVLEGFLMDIYQYPNEQNGIPETNVTQGGARLLCEERGKRLCTELEWERACKGESNTTYENGNRYVAELCGTGASPRALPSGYRFGCRSAFGVHDMHGGLWEWTDSDWGRGRKEQRVSLRGGNGVQGEVVGRCANAQAQSPNEGSAQLGFRCCKGPRNSAEVQLNVESGKPLTRMNRVDKELAGAALKLLPAEVEKRLRERGKPWVSRQWHWRPLGNEDLVAIAVCAGVSKSRMCGVFLLRRTLGSLDLLDWADSGHYVPTLKLEHNPRLLWVYGGDKTSHYRRAVSFEWGRVSVGKEHRNIATP